MEGRVDGLETLLDYAYDLPEHLIAQAPLAQREASRLLVLNPAGPIHHRRFTDLAEYLRPGDLLVANNSKVIPARLVGQRVLPRGGLGGRVECLLLENLSPLAWECALHASAKYLPGLRFRFETPEAPALEGEVIVRNELGTVQVRFNRDPVESGAGMLPLPKYIARPPDAGDLERYNTVYASRLGSAAAPTAGFHFTQDFIQVLKARGIEWEEVTLHVGLGTFRPVKTSELEHHEMHEEQTEVSERVAEKITQAKREGRRVIAVGTTSVRCLESHWNGHLRAGRLRTKIFIRPGSHTFQVVDGLITNFHLPGSTLLMLVSAMAGRERVLGAYREAVAKEYRFFSYGDAMFTTLYQRSQTP